MDSERSSVFFEIRSVSTAVPEQQKSGSVPIEYVHLRLYFGFNFVAQSSFIHR